MTMFSSGLNCYVELDNVFKNIIVYKYTETSVLVKEISGDQKESVMNTNVFLKKTRDTYWTNKEDYFKKANKHSFKDSLK